MVGASAGCARNRASAAPWSRRATARQTSEAKSAALGPAGAVVDGGSVVGVVAVDGVGSVGATCWISAGPLSRYHTPTPMTTAASAADRTAQFGRAGATGVDGAALAAVPLEVGGLSGATRTVAGRPGASGSAARTSANSSRSVSRSS